MEETWKIILQDEIGGAGPSREGTQAVAANKAQEEIATETKKAAPTWSSVGRFLAPLISVAGILAFVIQMVRRSKVFSTFMDSFLTILSAVVDILFIPLIPLLFPVLKFLLNLIPLAMSVSKSIAEFLKDPWAGLKNLFQKLVELPKNIGEFLGKLFTGMGLGDLGKAFADIGRILSEAGGKIAPMFNKAVDNIVTVWSNKGLSFWQKILETAKIIWQFIGDSAPIMWDAIREIWLTVIAPGITKIVENVFGKDAANIINKLLTGDFRGAWQTLCDWVGSKITGVWEVFYEGTLKPYWITFITIAQSLLSAVWSDLGKNASWFFTIFMPELFKQVIDWLLTNFRNFFVDLLSNFLTLMSGFMTAFVSFLPPLKSMVEKINDKIAETLIGRKEETEGIVDISKIEGPPGFIDTAEVFSKIPAAWNAAQEAITEYNRSMKEGKDKIDASRQAMEVFTSTLETNKSTGLDPFLSALGNNITSMIIHTERLGDASTLISNLGTKTSSLISWFSSACDAIGRFIQKLDSSSIIVNQDILKGFANQSDLPIPSYQTGKEFVSKDTLAFLHRGERVVRAGAGSSETIYNKPINISNVYNISSGAENLLATVKSVADQSLKLNQMRGYI